MNMPLIIIVNLVLTVMLSGCGVKGDPLQPLKPTPLGRGRPTYKKAVQDFAVPNLPPVIKRKSKEKLEDEEERER